VSPATYHLVGCPDCRTLWIRDQRNDTRDTRTACQRCGSRHRVRELRTVASGDDVTALQHARGERLAEQAGQRDLFDADMEEFATRKNVSADPDLFCCVE